MHRRYALFVAIALIAGLMLVLPASAFAELPDAPNSMPGMAIPPSPFNGVVSRTTDVDDYYAIGLVEGDTLEVTLTYAADADVDLYLYGPGGSQVAWSVWTASPDTITYTVTVGQSGMYNVRAFYFPWDWTAENNPYTITWKVSTVRESDCFTEQAISIPLKVAFTIGHKLKVSVNDTSINLGAKLLPGDEGAGSFVFKVWSNDDVECAMNNTDFTGDDKGVNDEDVATLTCPDGVIATDWGPEARYDTDEHALFTIGANRMSIALNGNPYTKGAWQMISDGPTGDAGVTCNVALALDPITYADHAGYYTSILTLDVRQF